MPIRLQTLGGLHAFDEDGELDWLHSQRLRAALITYLAVERTASRVSLLTIFWPERDEKHARRALRQNLFELRQVLGADWVESHGHDLRISPAFETDEGAFRVAVEAEEWERASRLYAGAFLNGVHPIDVKPWEMWVDRTRADLAREFRRASRAWVEACRVAADHECAIEAAEHWVSVDPLDDEAQHKLIEVLAEAGRRTDALRQYEVYGRLLEAEGLDPLDDTKALVERVESDGEVGPASEVESLGSQASPHDVRPVARRMRANRLWRVAMPAALGVALLVAVMLLEPWRASATIDGPERILVLPLAATTDSSAWGLDRAIVGAFVAAINSTADLIGIDGSGLEIENLSIGAVDAAVEAAQGVNAAYVVNLQLLRFGPQLQLAYTVTAVASREQIAQGVGALFGPDDSVIGRLSLDAASAIALYAGGDRRLSLYAPHAPAMAVLHLVAGQTQFSRDQVVSATDHFHRALAADSSFGYAYYWLSMAMAAGPNWDHSGALDVLEIGLGRATEMSRTERTLLEGQRHNVLRQADSATATFERLAQMDEAVPEALVGLGEAIYHYAAYVGRERHDALDPFERAASVSPNFIPSSAFGHMVEMALHAGDTTRAREILPLTTRATDESRIWYTTAFRLTAGDGLEKRAALDTLPSVSGRTLAYLVVHLSRAALDLTTADTVAGLLLAPGRNATERALGAGYRLAISAAPRWRPSVQLAMPEPARSAVGPGPTLRLYEPTDWPAAIQAWKSTDPQRRWDRWVMAAHLAGYDTEGIAEDMLDRARRWWDAGRIPDFRLDPNEELRQAQRALIHEAFLRGDASGVRQMVDRVDAAIDRGVSPSDPLPEMLRAVLSSRLSLLSGDTATAISLLEDCLGHVAEPRIANFPLTTMAPERLRLAELFIARGDFAAARPWLDSFRRTSSVADLFYHVPVSTLRQSAPADLTAS